MQAGACHIQQNHKYKANKDLEYESPEEGGGGGGGATEMSDCFVKNRARLGCMQKINQELEDGWSSD